MNYFFGVCVCVCVCVHNFHCVNLMRQTQIVAIQGAENNCRSE